MTCKEWIAKNKPEWLDPFVPGGVVGCPGSDHNDVPGMSDCIYSGEGCFFEKPSAAGNMCDLCWSQQVPGTEKNEKVIFISGPVTGVGRYWEAFEAAEDELQAAGFIPLSPARLPSGMTNAQYMRITLSMIDAADAVLSLPGWASSRGATLETMYCQYTGKTVATSLEELKELIDG